MAYQTEQKKVLLDFLSRHRDEAFSIDALADAIRAESPAAPGKSTLYRLMPQLVDEGRVKRFNQGHSRHFLYQLVACAHCTEHMHLRCTVCGKLYHLEDQESAAIVREILEKHHFAVDGADTTLMGCCEGCKKGNV
jgi:Fur family ferric uptake transcriptional regulator